MRKAILILICAMMTVSWASWAQAQSASSSYEDEAMGYIEAGEEAEAEGDYASACSYYGEASGKFDWVHDALIEESLTTVERDAYGNVTNDTLESNLRIASQNGAKAYDRKVAACARASSSASAPPAPEPEPKILTAPMDIAGYWMQQAKDQYDAGDHIEACVSLRKSATIYSNQKVTFRHEQADPEAVRQVDENLKLTSQTMPSAMNCPTLAEETTAAFAYAKTIDDTWEGVSLFTQGENAEKASDTKEACRLYTMALASFASAKVWIDRLKSADSHELFSDDFVADRTRLSQANWDETDGKVKNACKAAG